MSAYDNPTIIKDDSALIWGQAAGGFAESFMQSFNTARQRRDAEIKAREAKEKEAKQQTLNDQIFLSESRYKNQNRMEKIDDGLVKAGADATGVELLNNYIIKTGEIDAKNNLSINRDIQSPEALAKKNGYSAGRSKGEENLVRITGGLYAQTHAINSGEINDTNVENIKYKGNNILDQTLNRTAAVALAYPDPKKTTKELLYNAEEDPSDITLEVKTNIGTRADVFATFEKTNPGVPMAEREKAFTDGLANGNIIESGEGDNKQYAFNFKKKMNSDYDGTLYVKIPKIEYGESPIAAGVYSKEGDTQIANMFKGPLEYEAVVGNAKLSKDKGTVMYERIPVDMEKIKSSMKAGLQAKAEGLIASSLQDNDVADGVLKQLGFGTNYPSKVFAKLTTEEKVAALVNVMEEKEIQNIITKSDLKPIKDDKGEEKYYIMDEANNKIFSEASNKGGSGGSGGSGSGDGGQTKADVKAQANLNKAIKGVYDMTAKGTGSFNGLQGRKVIHRNGRFIIDDGGLKGNIIDDKNKVVEYLRDGTY